MFGISSRRRKRVKPTKKKTFQKLTIENLLEFWRETSLTADSNFISKLKRKKLIFYTSSVQTNPFSVLVVRNPKSTFFLDTFNVKGTPTNSKSLGSCILLWFFHLKCYKIWLAVLFLPLATAAVVDYQNPSLKSKSHQEFNIVSHSPIRILNKMCYVSFPFRYIGN